MFEYNASCFIFTKFSFVFIAGITHGLNKKWSNFRGVIGGKAILWMFVIVI